MVSLCQHYGDLVGDGITIKVMHGNGETPLSKIRMHEMGITLSIALDMCGSLHLTILYLLRVEYENLESLS